MLKNLWHAEPPAITASCGSTQTGTAASARTACLPIHDAVTVVAMEDGLECFMISR